MIISPHKEGHLLLMPDGMGGGNFAKLSAFPGFTKFLDRNLVVRIIASNILYILNTWPDAEWIGGCDSVRADYLEEKGRGEEIARMKSDPAIMPDVSDYQFHRSPMSHQEKAFALSRDAAAFGLFMEQGCVDKNTEYLSPTGWVKISEYKGGEVAQYDPETGEATFVKPEEYVVKPCGKFYHFYHEYGLNQMLSEEHRMLIHAKPPTKKVSRSWINKVWRGLPDGESLCETTVRQLVDRMSSTCLYSHIKFPNSFQIAKNTSLPFSDDQIRLQVAFNADGSYGKRDLTGMKSTRKGCIRIKKQRKKTRLEMLLKCCNTPYVKRDIYDGFSVYIFNPPMPLIKNFSTFWDASPAQTKVILDECKKWDGSDKGDAFAFFSSKKVDADFIQYCAASNGRRSKLVGVEGEWTVGVASSKTPLTNLKIPRLVKVKDGKKYCFKVPTSCLVFRREGCVFCSGNTGKTKVIIDNACYLYKTGKIDALVIVAWPNGVHRNWVDNELPEDMSVPYVAEYWNSDNAKTVYRKTAIEKFLKEKKKMRVFAFNVEAFVSPAAQDLMLQILGGWRCMLAIDQSASIKNPQAGRTKFLIDKCSGLTNYRRVLDGAPVAEGAEELYSQFKFLDPNIIGHDTWTGFKAEFCRIGRFREIIGYNNLEELRRRIDGYCYRVLAKDCLDLPERIYKIWPFDLSEKEARHFSELSRLDLTFFKDKKALSGTEIDNEELEGGLETEKEAQDTGLSHSEHIEEHRALVKNLRLQQISSGWWPGEDFKLINTGKDATPSRLDALLLLLAQAEGKALIFSRFRADLELLQKVLGPKAAVSYHGGVKDDDRAEAKRRFMKDPKTRYFLGQPYSAGIGHTLTSASHVIFYSNDASLRMREECEKRAHRQGLKNSLIIWDLIARQSHDMKIVKSLRNKKELANEIMKDPENFFLQHEKI